MFFLRRAWSAVLRFPVKTLSVALSSVFFLYRKTKCHACRRTPNLLPIILNAWQGKPPVKISWFGTFSASIWVMSPNGFSPKFASYIIWHRSSRSEEKTHFPPARSKAIRMPPIPANKSTNLNFSPFLFRMTILLNPRSVSSVGGGSVLPRRQNGKQDQIQHKRV